MKIYYGILDEILKAMPSLPPEKGGIIGGKEGKICHWEYDDGYPGKGCMYCPNVEFLNKIIALWMNKGYDFMGIVHVHFGGSKELSDGDKRYIEKIMRAMPDSIEKLFFPIVVQPEKQIVSYVANRGLFGQVRIVTDEVEVIFRR